MNLLTSHPRLALLSAFAAGVVLPFAFAPFEIRIFAGLSPALLFVLWLNGSAKKIYLSGLLFQLGFFASGVHWVYYSIHLFGNAVAPLAAVITAFFIAGLAFICSVSGILYARLASSHTPFVSAFLFSAIWVFVEWIRAWLFGGFPWLTLGYSQIDTWFSAFAPLFGVYGISVLLLLSSSLSVVLFTSKGWPVRITASLIIAIISISAIWINPIQWTVANTDAVTVRMVQGNVKQQLKFDKRALQKTLDSYIDLSRYASEKSLDIIIWPETAIPTLFHRTEDYLQPFIDAMQQSGTEVLSGGFKLDDKDQVYNAFRQLTGSGQIYLKSHLVPFGEFMPFRFILDSLASLIAIPMSDLSAGPRDQSLIKVKGEKIGVSICYEDAFGEEMRAQLPEATLLVNVSNDTWFGDSAAPFQHQEIAAMRAREFARPLVRVTNTGISAFISARGKVLQTIPQFKQGVLDRKVITRRGATPYVQLGNYPVIVFFTLVLFVGFIMRVAAPCRGTD